MSLSRISVASARDLLIVCVRFIDRELRVYKKAGLWAPRMIGPLSSIRLLLPLGFCATTGEDLYGDEDTIEILDGQ